MKKRIIFVSLVFTLGFNVFAMNSGFPFRSKVMIIEASMVEMREGIQINWNTHIDEVNEDYHFEILRSKNGVDWKKIGTMEKCLHHRHKLYYHFIDTTGKKGKFSYKVCLVNKNGAVIESEVIGK